MRVWLGLYLLSHSQIYALFLIDIEKKLYVCLEYHVTVHSGVHSSMFKLGSQQRNDTMKLFMWYSQPTIVNKIHFIYYILDLFIFENFIHICNVLWLQTPFSAFWSSHSFPSKPPLPSFLGTLPLEKIATPTSSNCSIIISISGRDWTSWPLTLHHGKLQCPISCSSHSSWVFMIAAAMTCLNGLMPWHFSPFLELAFFAPSLLWCFQGFGCGEEMGADDKSITSS